jgi:hypothetical protein
VPIRLKSDRTSLGHPNNPDGSTSHVGSYARASAHRPTAPFRKCRVSLSAKAIRELVEARGVEPLTS